MTPDELRQHLELKIVELIKRKMSDGSLSEDRAQQISQFVLDSLHPGMGFEDIYRVIPKLDDHYPELTPVVLPMLEEYERNVNKKAMEAVSELIRQGQFDAAAKLGKQTVNQEIKLVWTGSGKP